MLARRRLIRRSATQRAEATSGERCVPAAAELRPASFSSEGVTRLLRGVARSAVTDLDISGADLGYGGARAGLEALCVAVRVGRLARLNVARNRLCDPDLYRSAARQPTAAARLCEALRGSSVTALDVRGNAFDPAALAALQRAISARYAVPR